MSEATTSLEVIELCRRLRLPYLRQSAHEVLLVAAEDLTAFRHFRAHHWQKIWSTNSLERLNAVVM